MKEKFNMFDVADLLGWSRIRRSGKSWYIECPFCHTRKLKCNITENYFNCFGCDTKGNFYSVFAKHEGIVASDGKTANQVARAEILRRLQLDEIVERKQWSKPINEKTVEPRSREDIDKAYRKLIQYTSLSEKHKEALKKRGLTEYQIKLCGFRSVNNDRAKSVCRLIQNDGIALDRVPGFFKDKDGNFTLNTYKQEGYLCPVFDSENYLIGFQNRLDIPLDGQKYLWLSSKDKRDGVTSGSPSTYYGPKKCETIYIVDGVLKALVCYCLVSRMPVSKRRNVGFVGVAGVNNYRNIEPMIASLIKHKGVKNVVNAYDMDEYIPVVCDHDHKKCGECESYISYYKCNNCPNKIKKVSQLKKGSEKLKEICQKLKLNYTRYTWELENNIWCGENKGLDDYWQSKLERQ